MTETSKFVKNMKSGEILKNKRVLSAMKKKGLIYGYNEWGELTTVNIGGVINMEIFSKGNALDAIGCDIPTRELIQDKFGNNRMINYEGVKFTTTHVAGGVTPYLVKLF